MSIRTVARFAIESPKSTHPRAMLQAITARCHLDGPEVLHQHGAFTLRSAFQPIFSISHQRLIGHEALLRATDASGVSVSPQTMFRRCADAVELRALDQVCRSLHARTFANLHDAPQWLFLNVDASSFDADTNGRGPVHAMLDTARDAGLMPSQIVIELLEGALPSGPEIVEWAEELRRLGFLIALDDFGAGHSNFDRVFRLRPHIVKLDRSVIARAAQDPMVRRVTTQMISLLHECGSLVLVEGIETDREAAIAMDADADFVQGYYFGRPAPGLRDPTEPSEALESVWQSCDERYLLETTAYRQRLQPYVAALTLARDLLEAGQPMAQACAPFLNLADSDVCYLLSSDGAQVGDNLPRRASRLGGNVSGQFAPLLDAKGARWSRRPYFRRAVASPGQLQVTRPYPTMQSHRICVTLSVCYGMGDDKLIVCGDMLWSGAEC